MSDLDKELGSLAQKFFNESTGGTYVVNIPKTEEYVRFERAIKQAIEKHVIPARRNDTHHNEKITALITGYNQSSNDARKALYERKEA